MCRIFNSLFHKAIAWFFPSEEIRRRYFPFFLLFAFKILWFDLSWCLTSTFRPFSYAELYISGILLALALALPAVVSRSVGILWALDAALGLLLVSNLIYFRTYYTAIPLSTYGLVLNLRDFTSSVYGSLRWEDFFFPLSTLVAAVAVGRRRSYRQAGSSGRQRRQAVGRYLLLMSAFAMSGGALSVAKGGFKKAYETLQDSYTYTCGAPMYTVIGSAYYDYIREKERFTPEISRHIEAWLSRQAGGTPSPAFGDTTAYAVALPDYRTNCILILAESLESWALEQSVEGQEIMPYMNRLLRDSTTLYAPRVLSQVKGGRSIDAQLMVNTGLLPIDIGVYSLRFPYSRYPSLAKAMREKYGSASAYTMTADKPMVWNQQVITPAFGYSGLISKGDFVQDEKVGPHYRRQLGDLSLLRQCAEKIRGGEVWNTGANLLQIVTYSGHFPFVLPDRLKEVHFSGAVPGVMGDYLTVANYTDRALGLFIEAIRSMPEYAQTLVVVMGDHEGLADRRESLCRSEGGRGVVSQEPYIPFIVLNIPSSRRSALRQGGAFDFSAGCIRYEKVMGQIDIYPTLQELLHLTDYPWKGLGRSILDPARRGIAVDARHKVYGDTTAISPAALRHLKDAWSVSDEIIRYDYLK
jgi:phosphoglycerol transferase MdoB-like AlkP superfamily enzyme